MAVDEYKKAVDLMPSYVTAWNNYGDALEAKKDLKAALKAYDMAVTFSPENDVRIHRSFMFYF